MFAMTPEQRWHPNWRMIGVLLALSVFLVTLTSAVAALRGPRWLGYHVVPAAQAHRWRVTFVWPASFAWDAGLRRGTLLQGPASPPTSGSAVVHILSGRCCRHVLIPPWGDTDPTVAWLELPLAAVILGIGAGTLLFARAGRPAFFLLLFCLDVAVGLCGAAAFAHGALWGSILFETCWFALLPPFVLLLATTLPPDGRTPALGWRVPVLVIGLMVVLEVLGLVDVPLYTLTRDMEGLLFIVVQALASGIWGWRAWAARGGPHWPEYRLVLLGLGGAFAGFALLAILPAMLQWRLPWPPEVDSAVLLLFPISLSWALIRYRLLDPRRTVQRTVITVLLLGSALCLGLVLAADRLTVVALIVVVLVAGIGVPLAQRAADRVLPDGQAAYAALVQRSGERLLLAVEPSDLMPILEDVRRGLGLTSLCLRRGDALLAQVGTACNQAYRIPVQHDAEAMATLEVGEKLHHDTLLAADREALAMICQHLGAFLTGQRLLLQLRDTVGRLEETQQRLLTSRRRERERLGERLHRGPLQDIVLLRQTLTPDSHQAAAALRLETSLRTILTETASTLLRDFGLPAAIGAYVTYLEPYARERGCAVTMTLDDAAGALAEDESFALYQLAHEALTNAVRHSDCRQVDVRLQVEGDAVVLDVNDDGCGLPLGWQQARVDHRGLRDALELVQTVRGASATADTTSNGGTVIRARIPWRGRAQRDDDQMMQREDMISIVVAEDHAVMRQGLRRLLAEDDRLVVVAEARTGYEILGLVMQHQPDVLLLDIDLPGQNGLDALRTVKAHIVRPPRTLVLSAFHAEEYICRARELGVAGFLSKDCDGERVRDAIHRIMAGEQVFDPVIAAIMRKQCYTAKGRFKRYSDGSQALSPAELDVLHGMLEGQSYEEIAGVLGRERGTVRSQAATIFDKLAVGTRGQAVRKALQLGILQLNEDQPRPEEG